jgi:transcriptional regulator with XRE-family HTH domain
MRVSDTLAKNMRRLRATRKLTQEALTYDCRINRTYLNAVERAERNSITLRGLQLSLEFAQ